MPLTGVASYLGVYPRPATGDFRFIFGFYTLKAEPPNSGALRGRRPDGSGGND
mgnify:CR=1 FL=1|jgi:hypothetical protein